MAEADRIAAALAYQEQMPAMLNPNLARQGARGRENMMPPTSVMDERYPAWKRNQEDVEKLMLGVDLVGSAIPLAGPAVKGAKVLGQHAAPQLAQALENYAFKSGMALPMDVWHGSPHRFPPTAKNPLGEFDPTKMGTGEGAQAYGMGHYLAEARDVSKFYVPRDPAYEAKLLKLYNDAERRNNYQTMEVLENAMMHKTVPELRELHPEQSKLIDQIAKIPQKGSLYKVDLSDEAVAKMLDWDKPVNQQSWFRPVEDVVAEYKAQGKKPDAYAQLIARANSDPTQLGKTLYASSSKDWYTKDVAQRFKDAGIPGIRYLDEGSRGAGQGTSNFVVFPGNEDLLKILERQ